MKWEYKTHSTLSELSATHLNTFGIEGWELVGFALAAYSCSTSAKFHYIFKRPKP